MTCVGSIPTTLLPPESTGVIEMKDWMLNLNTNDKRMVEMAQEYTETESYAATVREALLHYIENNGGDSPDAE